MKEFDFPKHFETIGKEFQVRIEKLGNYKQPTGVGDARESVVRNYLKEVIPTRFLVERGKIFDSQGKLSNEFDVVISERSETMPIMQLHERQLFPIETVYGIIEVKSKLQKREYNKFINGVCELDLMKRFYSPVNKHYLQDGDNDKIEKGFNAQDNRAGQIWSAIVAFDAPQGKKLSAYLEKHCEGFIYICIPGREIVMKSYKTEGFMGIPYGIQSFPLMVWFIMELLTSNSRPRVWKPNYNQYLKNIVNALGDHKNMWRAIGEKTL